MKAAVKMQYLQCTFRQQNSGLLFISHMSMYYYPITVVLVPSVFWMLVGLMSQHGHCTIMSLSLRLIPIFIRGWKLCHPVFYAGSSSLFMMRNLPSCILPQYIPQECCHICILPQASTLSCSLRQMFPNSIFWFNIFSTILMLLHCWCFPARLGFPFMSFNPQRL